MVIIGVDPHPDSHTAAALDPSGKHLGSLTVSNTPEGLRQLWDWARQFPARRWAIEGAGNRFLAAWVQHLFEHRESMVNIPPSLTSQYRARRGKKKTDEIDAANAARALLANPALPAYRRVPRHRDLRDLSRARHRLVKQRKANRMALAVLGPASPAREALVQAIAGLDQALADLERVARVLVKDVAPELLDVRGVGVNLAAVLLAEADHAGRFASADAFASYCGAAPIQRSSGRLTRVQVNPGGNRRLNYALHMMAVVRLRCDGGRSKRLVERKVAEGKTKRQALRILKTYLAREVYRVLVGIEQRRRAVEPITA